MVKYVLKRKKLSENNKCVYLCLEGRGSWHYESTLEKASTWPDHNHILRFVAGGGLDRDLGDDELSIVKIVSEEVCTRVLKEIE